MKVVYVNDIVYGYAIGDPAARGGAERYGWHLMRALAHAGWSVTVGVYSLPEGTVRVIDEVKFLGLSRRTHFLLDWYTFLKNERPDWCFWQCADHLWGPAAEIAQWLQVRTIFSTMHDRDVQPRIALKFRKYWWPLYVWGLRRSNLIFVQHQDQRDQLAAPLRNRAFPLPGIVPLPGAVKPHFERKEAVLWVAVIRPVKRPDRLIEIARRLPMIRFIVCGAPSFDLWDAKEIESILAQLRSLPNVDFRGHVDPDETLNAISDASLLLSTSDGEGFPSVFLEAWAAGTPVVSVQIDPDGKIRNSKLGEMGDTLEGTIEAVRSLMASSEQRQEMGLRARRHVEEVHSPSSAVRAFEAAVAAMSTRRLPSNINAKITR
ncbi:MAG: glycosyltransferase family 4 protein [Nitrospira sp.]